MKHTTKIWLVLSLALVVLLMGATLAFAADTEAAGDVTTSTETTDTASEATTEAVSYTHLHGCWKTSNLLIMLPFIRSYKMQMAYCWAR